MRGQVLIIAGLDPGGGAGLIADVRMVERHGLRPVGVVTATTVQDTSGVRAIEPTHAEVLGDQLSALLSDVEVAAVKIGMLGSEAATAAVARALELTSAPVVWDPVARPSAGRAALYDGDLRSAAAILGPHLTLSTPNCAEARALAGAAIDSVADLHRVAAELCARLGSGVLITGGHLEAGAGEVVDVLAEPGGTSELRGPRLPGGEAVHGTGCALSTAVACQLASGRDLRTACAAGSESVRELLAAPVRPGRGSPAIV